ncbi:NnrT protein [Antarcticimicrobium sediminis]|uniref:NnrT protein n=1 Tax=Antarcticimicrobium sediminis TaxID=2546227 RepID=A0A4R5EGX9_9RHOB|nr:NnrT protein [Antarcticimicrobium sediminis]TDE33544.1 NnrT protein [Antarcticimicrobium sediminis]
MRARGWSTARITLALYPLGAGAMGVNVFFAALILSWVGGPVLSTLWSFALGCVIGGPATWAFARHIRQLMDIADARPSD